MKEYTIILNHGNTMPRPGFSKIIGFCQGSIQEARTSIIDHWYELFPEEFYVDIPNEIKDSNDQVIYRSGDNKIGNSDKWITFQ